MHISFVDGHAEVPTASVSALASDIARRLDLSPADLAAQTGVPLAALEAAAETVGANIFWPFARLAYERRLIELIPTNGLPAANYDLFSDVKLDASPIGACADFSSLTLDNRPTDIAGHRVDFPLGVPASILTANSSFLRYYAERGYCVLTYKTVRSRQRDGHPFPQWLFLNQAPPIKIERTGRLANDLHFIGTAGNIPRHFADVGMANSFGIPSFAPTWWQDDLSRAREFVHEGHQVLIASIMSSADAGSLDPIVSDFVNTAQMVRRCGADIIELNLSCPNTTERAGDLYHFPNDTRSILRAVRSEVGSAPIFVKIGYLDDEALSSFFETVAPLVDGFVGINTIRARVFSGIPGEEDRPAFPGANRAHAGISGRPVREAAQRFARNLARLRDEYGRKSGRRLTLLGVGGVNDARSFQDRINTGVDAVQVCTGSYLNPLLGLEIRNAQGRVQVNARDGRMKGANAYTGASDRSGVGLIAAPRHEGVAMPYKTNEPRPQSLTPERAGQLIEDYFANTDAAIRRRDSSEIAEEIFHDMKLARDLD